MEREKNLANVWYEPTVELNHTNETLQVFLDLWRGKGADSLDSRGHRGNAGGGNMVAEKIELLNA